MAITQGLIGIFCFLAIAWIFSENRRNVDVPNILKGLFLQGALAVLLTQFQAVRTVFMSLEHAVEALKTATLEGTKFVFGYLGGGCLPFDASGKAGTFIFAFQALPTIMVVSALSMLLFHWRVLPLFVKGLTVVIKRLLGIGGALGVVGVSKIFLGNTEAPLLVRPYLKDFSRYELFAVMTLGMATTSAAVLALYSDILKEVITNPVTHILTSTVMSIPAALTIARLMVPQDREVTSGDLVVPYKFNNWMDAVSQGTANGLGIFLNIIAMLVVVIALVALSNMIFGLLPDVYGSPLTLQRILGSVMAPFAWLMGIPWEEATKAGQLLGTKTVLNEIIAYIDLAASAHTLSAHTKLILVYALCSFANFAGMGITIAGLNTMVPERRDEVVSLALKSVVAGTLATFLSGTVIGILSTLGLT